MKTSTRTGLARVTIAAASRRIDIVLPEQSPVADLLPTVLRYAGEDIAAEQGRQGGWLLRRPDGAALDIGRSLAAQQVRDGETLHLTTASQAWPETEYDDVVEAVADTARDLSKPWHGGNTRLATLTMAAAVLAAGLFTLTPMVPLATATPGPITGLGGLIVALMLLVAGTIAARALGDSVTGALLGGFALPYAFLGGMALLSAVEAGTDLTAPRLLIGSTALIAAAMAGLIAVVDGARMFIAGLVAGVMAVVGGLLATTSDATAAIAAGVLCVSLALAPFHSWLSLRFARVPLPDLPRTSRDLLEDKPVPPRGEIVARVRRANELSTGLALGQAIVVGVCLVVLLGDGFWGQLLAGLAILLLLLRSRALPSARARVPALVAAAAGMIGLIWRIGVSIPADLRAVVVCAAAMLLALVVLFGGLTASRRMPSPLLGRLADAAEVVISVSLIPVACAVLGLYAVLRGLGG